MAASEKEVTKRKIVYQDKIIRNKSKILQSWKKLLRQNRKSTFEPKKTLSPPNQVVRKILGF